MILALSGSLRRASVNSAALRAAAVAARSVSVPEYAFGIPGAFTNALDWTVGAGSLYRSRSRCST